MGADLANKRFEAPAPKRPPLRPCRECGGIIMHKMDCAAQQREDMLNEGGNAHEAE